MPTDGRWVHLVCGLDSKQDSLIILSLHDTAAEAKYAAARVDSGLPSHKGGICVRIRDRDLYGS